MVVRRRKSLPRPKQVNSFCNYMSLNKMTGPKESPAIDTRTKVCVSLLHISGKVFYRPFTTRSIRAHLGPLLRRTRRDKRAVSVGLLGSDH